MSETSDQIGDDLNDVGASMNHLLDLEERIASVREQLAAQPAYPSYIWSDYHQVPLTAEAEAQLKPFLASIADLEQEIDALWRIVATAVSSEFDDVIRALLLRVDHEKLAQWLGRNENKTSKIIQSLTGHPDGAYKALGRRAVYWIGR